MAGFVPVIPVGTRQPVGWAGNLSTRIGRDDPGSSPGTVMTEIAVRRPSTGLFRPYARFR